MVAVAITNGSNMVSWLVRNPASGKTTSLGSGGKMVSSRTSSPTPHSPIAFITRSAQPSRPVSSRGCMACQVLHPPGLRRDKDGTYGPIRHRSRSVVAMAAQLASSSRR